MATPAISVTIDETAVRARLTRMSTMIREQLRRAITREAIALQRLTKEKLSGPVLKNRTGRLRNSINSRVTDTDTELRADVGTNVRYARAHEYGFEGVVNVREHLRMMTQSFGHPMTPRQALVRAHPMHMHLPERSFLRSALLERAPSIRESLAAAMRAGIDQS